MGRLTALSLLLMVTACLLSVVASYNIGVGIADVTGPSAEIGFVSMSSVLIALSVCKPTHDVLICFIILQTRMQEWLISYCNVNQSYPTDIPFFSVLLIIVWIFLPSA
jgi:hypothetical protein